MTTGWRYFVCWTIALVFLAGLATPAAGFERDDTRPEGGWTGKVSTDKRMERVREQARAYSTTGEARYLEDAIEGAIEILRQDPTAAEAHLFLSWALAPKPAEELEKYPLEELKRFQQAAIKAHPDLVGTPGYIPYQVFRGLQYLGKKSGKQSFSWGALFFGSLGALATQDRDKGKDSLDKAQAEFKEAIRLKPDLSSAHRLLGAVYIKQGREELALTEAEEATRLDPNSLYGWDLLARIQAGRIQSTRNCYNDEAIDQAIKAQKQTVRLDPERPWYHYELGDHYSMKGMFDLALFEFREALRLSPEADCHAQIGHALFDLGHYDEALKELHEARRRKPDDPYTLRLLTVTNLLRNAFDAAVRESEQYLKTKKGKASPYVLLWQYLALRHMGRQGEADKAIRDFARSYRDQVWSFQLLQYYMGTMDGESLLKRAVNRCEQTEAHFYIGYDHLLKGDTAAAAGHFKEVLALNVYRYFEYAGAARRLNELSPPKDTK
jgi:lipoprotein NlpI